MIVCLCHRLSDRDIERAVAEQGLRSFEELQDETCVARNCACCEDCARELFDAARAACAVGAPLRLVQSQPTRLNRRYSSTQASAIAPSAAG